MTDRCMSVKRCNGTLVNDSLWRPAPVISNRLASEGGPILDALPDFHLAAAVLGPLRAEA